MKIKLLNVVVFAENYDNLVSWYLEAFNLEILMQESGEYHYTELGLSKQVILGITPASEIKHFPSKHRNNSSVMQLSVNDIECLFKQIESTGGKILFGPSKDEKYSFSYGGVADIEGNEIWIVEETIN